MLLIGLLAVCAVQDTKVDFESKVLPILRDRCVACHQAGKTLPDGRVEKPKAGLRMDGKGWILKGGENGIVLTPGEPTKSPLYARTVLPAEHDDHMPPKGDPLTKAQTETLRLWIVQGAAFGTWVGAPGGKVEPAASALPPPPIVSARLTLLEKLGKGVAPATSAELDQARKAGATVEPAAPGTPLLAVSFVSKESATGDKGLAELAPLARLITQLDLGRTKISDTGLKFVSTCALLTKLDVHATAVTDAGLGSLSGLKELRSLNIYGTAVTDAGLASLEGMKTIEDLYLRETKTTAAGVAKLQEKLPDLEIHGAFEAPTTQPGAATARKKKK
jgi:hypothetical protein